MKKFILTLCLAAISIFTVNAEPLFPFFVDLVGDYTTVADGSDSDGFTHLIGKTNAGGDKSAESFLDDTLPSSYSVVIDENTVGANRIRTYSSAMADGRTSVIYFIWTPEGHFSIEYAEGPFTSVIPYCQ